MKKNIKNNIDNEWADFISDVMYEEETGELDVEETEKIIISDVKIAESSLHTETDYPKVSDIYISTKTKIAYLNKEIDLKTIFWKIPVMEYSTQMNCVIKKQMKFNSFQEEELNEICEHLKKEKYYEEYVITSINNPNGRIKFKDIRKISVGISKKDLISYRCKKKSAFYNCFVVILRIKIDEIYKEFHVKVFNTGKMEIPGVQKDSSFSMICEMMIELLQPYFDERLELNSETNSDETGRSIMTETVLINSNFNAGFYINREVFYDILQMKYGVHCIYDPCSYPGIQCKIYYSEKDGIMKSKPTLVLQYNVFEISFMIFRTGSVLIVGKCDENVLGKIYEFLRDILYNEYDKIGQKILASEKEQLLINKNKKKKLRKKEIYFDSSLVEQTHG
jgi:hypothetical protein